MPIKSSFQIAVDGPAGAGKGTLAKHLAEHYSFAYLDTGLLYRAIAFEMLSEGHDLADEALAAAHAQNLNPAEFFSNDSFRRDSKFSMSAMAAVCCLAM